MYRILAPTRITRAFSQAPGAPFFVDGVAYTAELGFVGYFQTVAGYWVERVDQVPAEHAAAVRGAMLATGTAVVPLGAPLRDAAVDLGPGDASAPTNAGRDDPHGPQVIAPEALSREEQAAVLARAVQAAADGRLVPPPRPSYPGGTVAAVERRDPLGQLDCPIWDSREVAVHRAPPETTPPRAKARSVSKSVDPISC